MRPRLGCHPSPPGMNSTTSLRLWIGLPLALLLAGCTAAHYRKSADATAYRAIRQKTPLVPNMDPHFTIEQTNQVSLDAYPMLTNVADFLGQAAESEKHAKIISLEQALDIAVNHSRVYQNNALGFNPGSHP